MIVKQNTETNEKKKKVRLTKRQLQAMETKNKIYLAAVREINEKGFNNVNIEDITTAAKVAKGTFYTHFESKEAIIAYTFEQSDQIYEQAIKRVEGKSFLYMATYFVRFCYTEYEKRGKGIIKAMISNYFNFPGKNFYSHDRVLYQCLMKIAEDGKQQQVLDASLPTEYYADILLSTMVGVEVMWCFDDQERSLADMIEEIIRITALGLMK
ncbi:MAG: TetR/AcrR family transcriptional regulator [Clostridia bacterium]|nr:TetR/AcrR family transcriptional regulator [Clostridia bacterium]